MNNKSALRASLTKFVQQKAGGIDAVMCKVDSVDEAKKNCVCVPLNGNALIPAVRLQTQDAKGILIFPKAGSMVIVDFLGDGSAYVSMFSDVDKVMLDVEKTIAVTAKDAVTLTLEKTLDVKAKEAITVSSDKTLAVKGPDGVTLNGDSLGGLPILKKILDNLNSLKNYVEKMNTAVGTGLNGVGASTAANGALGKTAYTAAMAGAIINFADMENKKVKHGDGS